MSLGSGAPQAAARAGVRTVTVSTHLSAPADVVWSVVRTPQSFVFVAGRMLRYPPAERIDRPWRVGDELVGRIWLFGVIPMSRHHLRIVEANEQEHFALSHEHGGALKLWRHRLLVRPLDSASCVYEDRIELDAGIFTPVVAAFAEIFFRYRQGRLRQLVAVLAASRN